MPEVDQKIEVLEEEIKVLKGEVRRTLVDLRAMLMREDSPLSEGSIGRRAALQDLDRGEDIQPVRRELSETVRQETVTTPVATPPPAPPAPQQQNAPDPGPASMYPPQMGVTAGMPMVQPGYAPAPAPVVMPAPQSPDPGMAEQQLRMADQERRLAEQERRLAEQDRKMAEAGRAEPPDTRRAESQREEVRDSPQQPARSTTEPEYRNPPEQAGMNREEVGDSPQRPAQSTAEPEDRNPPEQVPMNREEEPVGQPEKSNEGGTGNSRRQENSSGTGPNYTQPSENSFGEASVDRQPESPPSNGLDDYQQPTPVYADDSEYAQPGPEPSADVPNAGRRRQSPPIDAQIYEQPVDYQQEERRLPRPRNGRPTESNGRSGPAAARHPGEGLQKSGAPETEHRGSPVFDEYFDLLAEVEQSNAKAPEFDLPALDLNLVASLVRWASIAKQRVGEQRLGDILDLYFQSGHSSPGLQALLNQVVGMADEAPTESDSTSQVCVDLIAHLHGILTGGLPNIRMARITGAG